MKGAVSSHVVEGRGNGTCLENGVVMALRPLKVLTEKERAKREYGFMVVTTVDRRWKDDDYDRLGLVQSLPFRKLIDLCLPTVEVHVENMEAAWLVRDALGGGRVFEKGLGRMWPMDDDGRHGPHRVSEMSIITRALA